MQEEGQKSLDQAKKKAEREAEKARKRAFMEELVTCGMCGKSVKRKATAKTPIGPACKAHPGVGD